MTLYYYDPLFLEHETGDHPECAARVAVVAGHLQNTGLESQLTRPAWSPVSRETLAHVHTQDYVSRLAHFATEGGGYLDADTVCSPHSFEVALRASGAVCDAVGRVIAGEDRQAFCLVRPPGHHALPDHAMGFCLLNNVALGARSALVDCRLDRVLVVDWDVHHGNGTQASFWEDEQVGFVSIHRWPFYPGTGRGDETGGGRALGTKLNLPVEFGTRRRDYLDRFRAGLEWLAAKIQPQLLLLSAGFDAHREDPIGSLELETEDFTTLTDIVLNVADVYAGGRLVSVLEGGYNLAVLPYCVENHLGEMLRRRQNI